MTARIQALGYPLSKLRIDLLELAEEIDDNDETGVERASLPGLPLMRRYGDHGETVAGLQGTASFTLAGGRTITVETGGRFDRPYEPFQRGGLNPVAFTTDDGRHGNGIIEITGAHHHRYFPDTTAPGPLPC